MPSKTNAAWTQVSVDASCLRKIAYTALDSGGTSCSLSVTYQVKDNGGAVRDTRLHSQIVGAYPVTLAAILSAINTVEGT